MCVCVCVCAFIFIPVVVAIFDIFMNCPPPSHSMWCFFCCVRAFFGIDYRIIEFIGTYLSVKREIFMMEILKKNWGMLFFVGVQEKRNIYFKKKRKKSGNWDLISFPHCSYFFGFTAVYTHTFMLNCRLYNT